MSLDVLCVGDAVVDIFLLIDSNNPHFRFDKQTNELSIKLGDKIVFNGADFKIGGNACNVSVGLRRLGISSGIMTEIGSDEFAQKILYALKNEEVDTTFLKRGDGQTNFSIILNYENDRTIIAEKVEREHEFDFQTASCSYLYLTSLGEKWEKAFKNAWEFIKQKDIRLVLNPGTPQFDKGIDSFSYLFPKTEILIVNKQEAEKIIGREGSCEELVREIKKLGPKIVVVTDGKIGSYAALDENVLFEPGGDMKIVSTTGAGDAYSSGFLSAIIEGKSLDEALKRGTANAVSVIGKIGAQVGLLRKEEL